MDIIKKPINRDSIGFKLDFKSPKDLYRQEKICVNEDR